MEEARRVRQVWVSPMGQGRVRGVSDWGESGAALGGTGNRAVTWAWHWFGCPATGNSVSFSFHGLGRFTAAGTGVP